MDTLSRDQVQVILELNRIKFEQSLNRSSIRVSQTYDTIPAV